MFIKIIILASTLFAKESDKNIALSEQQPLEYYANASFECPAKIQQFVAEKPEGPVEFTFQEARTLFIISYDSNAIKGFVVDRTLQSEYSGDLETVIDELDSIENCINHINFYISTYRDGQFDLVLVKHLKEIKKSSNIIHDILKINYPRTAQDVKDYIFKKTLPLNKDLGVL